jgi:hypothetical protein
MGNPIVFLKITFVIFRGGVDKKCKSCLKHQRWHNKKKLWDFPQINWRKLKSHGKIYIARFCHLWITPHQRWHNKSELWEIP